MRLRDLKHSCYLFLKGRKKIALITVIILISEENQRAKYIEYILSGEMRKGVQEATQYTSS